MAVLKLLLLILALQHATADQESAQEEPPAGEKEQTLMKCKGDSVAFPWKSNTSADQHVSSVQWTYDNDSTSQIVGGFGNGQFNPGPSYKNRVMHVPDEGLVLKDLKTWDAGRYSTEVTGSDTSGLATSRRSSATLKIADGFLKLSTLDEGKLQLSLEPVAVWDSGLEKWKIRLTCGHFTAAERPPFDVMWENPSGTTLNSTTYADGKFILSLTAPFSEGAYSCRVPAELVQQACKFSNKKTVTDIVARLTLNKDTARMALMESRHKKEMAKLKKDNAALTSQLRDLKETTESTTKALSDRLESVSKVTHDLKGLTSQQVDNLKREMDNEVNELKGQVRGLTRVSNRKVAFTAALTEGIKLQEYDVIKLDHILLNEGSAYNKHTGIFTAPVKGVYFFIGQCSPMYNNFECSMCITFEGYYVAYNYAFRGPHSAMYQSAALHTALKLERGQRIWLETNTDNSYFRGLRRTVFSGFLVSAH